MEVFDIMSNKNEPLVDPFGYDDSSSLAEKLLES